MSNPGIDFTNRKATFAIVATVQRVFCAPSGKFAELTLLVPSKNGKDVRYKVRAFEKMVQEVSCVGVGQSVRALGTIEQTPLTSKDKNKVQVDGYDVWVPVMTLRKLDVETLPPSEGFGGSNDTPF